MYIIVAWVWAPYSGLGPQTHNVGLEAMSERKLFEIVVEYVEVFFVAKCMVKSVRTNLDYKSNNKSTTCGLSLD